MTIDQLIAELQKKKEEGVSGDAEVYVDVTTFALDSLGKEFSFEQDGNTDLALVGELH